MTNTHMLMDIIKSKGIKLNWLAEQLGLSAFGFSKKIRNVTEFKASEITKLIALLEIPQEQVQPIFFVGVSNENLQR